MEAMFSSWFLGPHKDSKIGYGLFLYALQPAKPTSASFMGAIVKEYLVNCIVINGPGVAGAVLQSPLLLTH